MRKFVIVVAAAFLLPSLAHAAPGDLAKAAMNNDTAQVTKLLASGADPNDRGESEATALMFAAQNGNGDAVRALITAGADVKATRGPGVTALHHAAAAGTADVIAALLDAGAVIDAKTQTGGTPLRSAIGSGRFENAELLFQRGADMRAAGDYEQALAWAISAPGVDGMPGPMVPRSMVDRLLAAGADPSRAQGGATALLRTAAARFQPEAIPMLIERGADVNAADAQGNTPLLLASDDFTYESALRGVGATMLLASGNEKTIDSRIIIKGMFTAEPTPALKAIGFTDVRNQIAEISARRSATIAALLAAGADAKRENAQKETPLYRLANSFDAESVKLVVKAGGDPLLAPANRQPPLHMAAKDGLTETVKAMLASGVDVNARNTKGQTPLMTAAMGGGDVETVIALLEAGADVAARDNGGNTPLHYAAGAEEDLLMTRATENAQAELVAKVLLAKGADPLARNSAGKTPRDLAKANKSKKYRASEKILADAEKARR